MVDKSAFCAVIHTSGVRQNADKHMWACLRTAMFSYIIKGTRTERRNRLWRNIKTIWFYVKKKYKLNVNSTLIFLIILFQFQVFSILSSIFSHVHSAIRNCNDYESLLYYKMFLYTQIQVCTHAYNP